MAGAPILVAGAGIAGLTAALALARKGWRVRVLERAFRLEVAGAGLQLSPNATRRLFALGLADGLRAACVRPEAVELLDAATLRSLAAVRLGAWGEARWGAPYLTCHRAELQRVLLDAVAACPAIELATGWPIADATIGGGHARLTRGDPLRRSEAGRFLVGADGVRSAVRVHLVSGLAPVALGMTAWRRTLTPAEAKREQWLKPTCVTAVLHPRVHVVAYPLHGGAFNLVTIARASGEAGTQADWQGLQDGFKGAAEPVRGLLAGETWTAWPLLSAPQGRWVFGAEGALIGDAAHAMPPFAAQGAAMAVEDAVTLAEAISPEPTGAALKNWQQARSARIARVRRRGSLNRLAWHAGGALAVLRDLVLRRSSPEKLAADLDWLYGT